MHHFNAKRMLYYNKSIISIEQTKIMGYFYLKLKKSKINKYLPDNDGVEEFTSPFR